MDKEVTKRVNEDQSYDTSPGKMVKEVGNQGLVDEGD